MSDDRGLEREIDGALAGMVAGDGPPDLRARVLARLEARQPARLRPALALAAVLALLALAGLLLRGERRPAARSTIASVPSSPAPSLATPTSPAPPTAETRRRARPDRRGGAIARRVPSEWPADAALPPLELEPIADPRRIAIARLEPARVESQPLVLVLAPIEIEPLTEDELPSIQ